MKRKKSEEEKTNETPNEIDRIIVIFHDILHRQFSLFNRPLRSESFIEDTLRVRWRSDEIQTGIYFEIKRRTSKRVIALP